MLKETKERIPGWPCVTRNYLENHLYLRLYKETGTFNSSRRILYESGLLFLGYGWIFVGEFVGVGPGRVMCRLCHLSTGKSHLPSGCFSPVSFGPVPGGLRTRRRLGDPNVSNLRPNYWRFSSSFLFNPRVVSRNRVESPSRLRVRSSSNTYLLSQFSFLGLFPFDLSLLILDHSRSFSTLPPVLFQSPVSVLTKVFYRYGCPGPCANYNVKLGPQCTCTVTTQNKTLSMVRPGTVMARPILRWRLERGSTRSTIPLSSDIGSTY